MGLSGVKNTPNSDECVNPVTDLSPPDLARSRNMNNVQYKNKQAAI